MTPGERINSATEPREREALLPASALQQPSCAVLPRLPRGPGRNANCRETATSVGPLLCALMQRDHVPPPLVDLSIASASMVLAVTAAAPLNYGLARLDNRNSTLARYSLMPHMRGMIAYRAPVFALKDLIKRQLPTYDANANSIAFAAVQASAGGLSGTILAPILLLMSEASRLTNSQKPDAPKGTGSALLSMLRRPHGLLELTLSFRLNLISGFLYNGLYFGIYDTFRAHFTGNLPAKLALAQGAALCGLFAAAPFEALSLMLRRRMVTSWRDWWTEPSFQILRGIRDTAIMSGVGMLRPRRLRTSVPAALGLVAYDELRALYAGDAK